MRRKLAGREGLTLVELLCAVVILILLGLILNTGIQMAVNSYRTMIAQSETELLLSTLADTLAGDLRYAEDVKVIPGEDKLVDSYFSDSYGEKTRLWLDDDGRVYADGGGNTRLRVLPDGAYGLNGRYEVARMNISYEDRVFTLDLSVREKDGSIRAETKLSVRCLNPEKKESEP